MEGAVDVPEATLPSGSKGTWWQAGWKPIFEGAAKASWAPVKAALNALIEQAKQKWA